MPLNSHTQYTLLKIPQKSGRVHVISTFERLMGFITVEGFDRPGCDRNGRGPLRFDPSRLGSKHVPRNRGMNQHAKELWNGPTGKGFVEV